MSIGIGLIGLGRHGGRYAQHLLDGITGCHLVAVSRRDRTAGQAFARSAGVVFVPDWREMVERKDIDAIGTRSPSLARGSEAGRWWGVDRDRYSPLRSHQIPDGP